MKDLTIIMPIVALDTEAKLEMFKRAYESATQSGSEILVIGDAAALETVTEDCHKVVNNGDTSFAAQVNLGAKECTTKYFSVLEYDDTFSSIWFANVEKYMDYADKDIFMYLPLTEAVENGEVIGYINEVAWASSFSNEIGFIDLESLENYLSFNLTGAIIKRDDFILIGGLKASMKLSFWYEFMLRAAYKEKLLFVIPKVGYYHTVNRDGSLTNVYAKTMSEKEAAWWVDLAKKEYFFPQDRNKTYEE